MWHVRIQSTLFPCLALALGVVYPKAASAVDCLATPSGYNIIVGDDGDNVLQGTPEKDWIDGKGGNDTITGLDDDDILCGGAGDDSIMGDNGNDKIFGGPGHDFLDGNMGFDEVHGGAGNEVDIEGGS